MASRASSSATSAGRIRRGRRGTATERRQKRIKKRRGCTRTRSEDDEEDGVSGESYVRGRKGGGGEGRRRKGVTVHRGVLPPPDAAANQSRRKREGGVDGRTDGGRRGERVVGIDLGTTNSAIALTSGSRSERGGIAGGAAAKRRDGVEIVADANGKRTTPSVVSFGGEDNSDYTSYTLKITYITSVHWFLSIYIFTRTYKEESDKNSRLLRRRCRRIRCRHRRAPLSLRLRLSLRHEYMIRGIVVRDECANCRYEALRRRTKCDIRHLRC